MNVLPPRSVVDWVLTPGNVWTIAGLLLAATIIMFAVRGLMRPRSAEAVAAGPGRHKKKLDDMASRWQLLLLGATGIVLSFASGYTTWAGMTNFTGESTLSAMITFGIQGVMLIVAWLIGESFAAGMNRQRADGGGVRRSDTLIGMVLAIGFVGVVFYIFLQQTGTFGVSKTGQTQFDWARFADVSIYFALALIVIAVLLANSRRNGDLSKPYIQSTRIIIKNAVLWVMFLACMATSVFFSFDSLFTAIFPKEERVRSAQLRAQNQVAGMVADIGSTIADRRLVERDALFRSKGWTEYDRHLTALATQSQGAQAQIEAYFNDQIEQKNRAIKQQQERISSAQSGSAGLVAKKNTLTDEIARLKGERPGLAADLAEKKSELDSRARGVDAKRVEAQAEDRGAEGTLKQGKGPMFRTLMADLARLQDALKIQETRVRDAQARLQTVDTRIAQLERELAAVDGDLARLRGEAETAQQRIKMTQEVTEGDGQPRIDPARVQPAFERARLEFRQEPTRDRLAVLQTQCSQLFTAMVSTPATRDRVRGIDCDPKQAAEAAAIMFALNDGLTAFVRTCDGGDKLEANKTTDDLYGFARRCLSDSGLPARETDQLRTKINFLELSRDDKAHPFVATINAFQDGNRLAYLALAIAIAMDSLIFMSGLFAANAVRSPLSDVPSLKARSGKDLEKLIESALGEEHERYDHARIVFKRLRPSTDRHYSMQISLDELSLTEVDVILPVLSAGREIGAVEPHPQRPDTYLVRGELFAFLSKVANRKTVHHTEEAREHELKKITLSALQPHVGDHVDIVLSHSRPISERNGFSTEIYLDRMAADHAFVVQKVLNAGATLNYVQLDEREGQGQRYYMHKQLYKTLLLIASMAPRTGQYSRAPQLAPPSAGAAEGGALGQHVPQLGQQPERAALPDLTGSAQAARAAVSSSAPSAPAPDSEEFRVVKYEHVAALVQGLGVDPDVYLSIDGETFGAAVAASEAFKAVQRTNRLFNQIMEQRESEAQASVDRVYERLVPQASRQRDGRKALDSAYDEVLGNLGIIAMLPGGPVDREIVSLKARLEKSFESDTARLDPEEEDLLRLVRRLSDQIVHNRRAVPEDWRRVHAGMQGPFAIIANQARQQQRGG